MRCLGKFVVDVEMLKHLFSHEENVSSSTNHMSKCAMARFRKRAVEIARQYGQRNDEEDERELERLSTITSERCGAEGLDWTSTDRGKFLCKSSRNNCTFI